MIIQTRTRSRLSTWLAGLVAVISFFALIAFANRGTDQADDETLTQDARLDAELQARGDIDRLVEISRIAREAHAQGMREALASVEGTAQGEAFQRSCARLWAGQQP